MVPGDRARSVPIYASTGQASPRQPDLASHRRLIEGGPTFTLDQRGDHRR